MFSVSIVSYSQSIDQSIILSSGSSSGDNQQVVWTLGDCQTSTYSNNNLIVTQGFLQVFEGKVDFIDEPYANNIDIELDVFPNPVVNQLNIKFKSDKKQKMEFELYTTNGKLLHSEQVFSNEYSGTLGFSAFNGGMYILKIKSKTENFIKTYKIFHHD